jgi:hypothetical protein
MKPQKVTNNQEELLRNRLSNQLNPKHELLQLAKMIQWLLEKNLLRFLIRSKIRGGQQRQCG